MYTFDSRMGSERLHVLHQSLGNAILVLAFLLYVNLMVNKSFLQSRKRYFLVLAVERLLLVSGVEQSRLWSVVLSFKSSLGSHFSGWVLRFPFNNLSLSSLILVFIVFVFEQKLGSICL